MSERMSIMLQPGGASACRILARDCNMNILCLCGKSSRNDHCPVAWNWGIQTVMTLRLLRLETNMM